MPQPHADRRIVLRVIDRSMMVERRHIGITAEATGRNRFGRRAFPVVPAGVTAEATVKQPAVMTAASMMTVSAVAFGVITVTPAEAEGAAEHTSICLCAEGQRYCSQGEWDRKSVHDVPPQMKEGRDFRMGEGVAELGRQRTLRLATPSTITITVSIPPRAIVRTRANTRSKAPRASQPELAISHWLRFA